MGFTSDEHTVTIGDSTVAVTGKTDPIYDTWALVVNEQDVDSAKAVGTSR